MLPLLSWSSLLQLPIVYKRVSFFKEVNKTTTVLFTYKTREIRHLVTTLLLQCTKKP